MRRKKKLVSLLVTGIFAVCMFVTAGSLLVSAEQSSLYKKYGFDFQESADKVQVLGAKESISDVNPEGNHTLFPNGETHYVPADGINQDNRAMTIRLPEKIKASDYSSINVYLLINQWASEDPDTVASYVSISAYAPTDTAFEKPAGTLRGNNNANTIDFLRIDPNGVADASGNVQNIVLRVDCDAKKYAPAVFFNYLELIDTVESLHMQTGQKVVPEANMNPTNIEDKNVTWFFMKDHNAKNEPVGYVDHPAFNFMNAETFPKATVENDILLLKNAVFAIKLDNVRASLYAQMNMDLLFADWNAGHHKFYLYGSSTKSFTDESGKPTGYVKELTTVGASTRANFKLDAKEIMKLANEQGVIDYIYVLWGGNEKDTADQVYGCPTSTSMWLNEITFLVEKDVPKPVVPAEKNTVDVSDLFPTGQNVSLNFKSKEENKNKVLTQAVVSMDGVDEMNFGIKPTTDTYSMMFLMRAADDKTLQDAWTQSGVFFWFSNDNVTLGSFKNGQNSGMMTLLAKDYPEGAFAKGAVTNVKITLQPFYIDGVESGYYAAVTIADAKTPQMELYFYSENISVGNYMHFGWQDLGKDIGFELSAVKQNAKKAEELMAVKIETSNGETGKVTLDKERATVKTSWYKMAGETVSAMNVNGKDVEYNAETGRIVFSKEGKVSLSFTVTNVFGTFESPVLELVYGNVGTTEDNAAGGCNSSLISGSAGICLAVSVLALASAAIVISFRRNRTK